MSISNSDSCHGLRETLDRIAELIKVLGFDGYVIKRARWRSLRRCCYCRMRIAEGFNAIIRISREDEWIYETCSRDHAIKLIIATLGKELARRLSNPIYADSRYSSFLKLMNILSKRRYEYISHDEPFRVHVFPENDKPEIIIVNNYPSGLGIWIDYIELNHRDFIVSLLDEIDTNFPDVEKELILDTRHTPYYEVNDVVKMVINLYCEYMNRGFKPSAPIRCGSSQEVTSNPIKGDNK